MLRQVIVPSKENSTVSIPAEYYGKEVEILMFPSLAKEDSEELEQAGKIERLKALFAPYQFDFSGYKFDREEANNYD